MEIQPRIGLGKCPYCGGEVGKVFEAMIEFDPEFDVFDTPHINPPMQGYGLNCKRCGRGYRSLSNSNFYCTTRYDKLVIKLP